ncbi:MAG: NAD(P)-dependent alcohol dehydrogenase [Gammaproteobacteria bacterium]|nr:MAG: NAD(P)-dependent alcohol dehydrogenase [Gammaproteobacteria bacterium]
MNRRRFLPHTTLATAGLPLRNVLAAAHAGPAMTRAWEVGDRKGLNSLHLVDRPAPVAGPGEVVIEVQTSAINARDRAIVAGVYPSNMAANRVPLSDGAGRIITVGGGVTQVAVGDRVISTHFIDWLSGPWSPAYFTNDIGNTVDGWLAELIVLPAQCLVRIPNSVSSETACTLPVAGVTAWHALRMGGMNAAGKLASAATPPIVLTLGTGGVSSWGLKLAKLAGAKVVITSSSDAKLERMQALGADIGINYKKNRDWGKQVVERTDGHGADIILENVGRPTLDQSMQAAAPNATIIMIGGGPPPKKLPTLSGLMMKNLTVKGLTSASRAMLVELMNAVAGNGIEAVIDKTFDFEQAVEAFGFMARSSHIGKVVIRH